MPASSPSTRAGPPHGPGWPLSSRARTPSASPAPSARSSPPRRPSRTTASRWIARAMSASPWPRSPRWIAPPPRTRSSASPSSTSPCRRWSIPRRPSSPARRCSIPSSAPMSCGTTRSPTATWTAGWRGRMACCASASPSSATPPRRSRPSAPWPRTTPAPTASSSGRTISARGSPSPSSRRRSACRSHASASPAPTSAAASATSAGRPISSSARCWRGRRAAR